MKRSRIPRSNGPSRPMLQIVPVRRVFPTFQPRLGRNRSVTWEGQLRPTSDSPGYGIRIIHEEHRVPRVFVVRPKLLPRAPHLYRDRSLCLYWPKEWSWWNSSQSLAETLIPWTALWLYYYEIWQITGDWLGPSSHHTPPEPEADHDRSSHLPS